MGLQGFAAVDLLQMPTGTLESLKFACAGQILGDENVRMLNRVSITANEAACIRPVSSAGMFAHLTGCDLPALQFDPSSSGSGKSYRWWEEAELRDLVSTVGLTDFQRDRRLRFIMFSAKKPTS